MRKIIMSIPITLDGFIEGSGRELDWVIADDELHEFYADLLKSADLILYGRVTYQLMADFWPKAASNPSLSKSEIRFANTLNPMPKIVFSNTLENVDWNTTLIRKFVPEEILELKKQPGGNILLGGGASLTQAFFRHQLVDEFQLVVQPTAIGKGKPLFQGIHDMQKMEFQWKRPFKSGAVALCYRPDGVLRPHPLA